MIVGDKPEPALAMIWDGCMFHRSCSGLKPIKLVRKKEIDIRKVFGASTSRIVVMMNSKYIRLVAIALLMAAPLSWWALKQWLDTFAYRIEISPWIFIESGLAMLLLALIN